MKDHIVMHGNPVDGFTFYGPFTKDEAQEEHDAILTRVNPVDSIWIISLNPTAKAG